MQDCAPFLAIRLLSAETTSKWKILTLWTCHCPPELHSSGDSAIIVTHQPNSVKHHQQKTPPKWLRKVRFPVKATNIPKRRMFIQIQINVVVSLFVDSSQSVLYSAAAGACGWCSETNFPLCSLLRCWDIAHTVPSPASAQHLRHTRQLLSCKEGPGCLSEHIFVILAWLLNNSAKSMLGKEIILKVG